MQVSGDLCVGTGDGGCVQNSVRTAIAGTCSPDARLKKNVAAYGPQRRDLAPFPRHRSLPAPFPFSHASTVARSRSKPLNVA